MSTEVETSKARPARDGAAGSGVTEEAIHAALVSGQRPERANALQAVMAFGWRCILKIKHVPEQLIDVTITPILFTLMFTYLFGGALAGSTSEYLQFLLPAMLVQSVLFTTVYSGVTLNTDLTKGVVDRFRSLPIWKPAPLVGAVVGDSLRYVVASAIVIAMGFILGFGAGGGVPGVLGAVLVVVLFSFALAWAFTTLGLVMRAPNAVMNTGFMVLFPIIFLSNAFVDPDTLPAGLKAFVDVNPISHLIDLTRALMHGTAVGDSLLVTAGTAIVLTAIFAPLTSHLYRTRG